MGILRRQRQSGRARAVLSVCPGRASFYDKARGFVTLSGARIWLAIRLLARQIGLPTGPAGARGSAARPRPAARPRSWRGRRRSAPPGSARPSNTCGRVYCGYSSSPCGEALLGARGLLAHDAGQEPHAGVDQHHGRDLAARQHVVADRDLLEARAPRSRARRRPRSGRTRSRRRAPRASAATRACVSGMPRGLISRRGRASSGATPRRCARASTSAFITMPGPPPAGVSSTVRCLSVACARMSMRVERPDAGRRAPCRRGSCRAARETSPGRS